MSTLIFVGTGAQFLMYDILDVVPGRDRAWVKLGIMALSFSIGYRARQISRQNSRERQ